MGGIIRPILNRKSTFKLCSGLSTCKNVFKCKLLVVGGGTGGCSVAWRFSKKLNDKDIIVLEPNQEHYYQPVFALVAAGIKNFPQSHKPMRSVMPRNVLWLRDEAKNFDPCNNVVNTRCGFKIRYDHMVVAVGLKNDYEQILGLKDALNNPLAPVSTIYSPEYCQKCWCCIQGFKGGHAIFTYPKQTGKCSGAAQKIMYLAHDFWKQNNINSVTNITFNTAGSSLFGVPKYSEALVKIANNKNIIVNYQLELIEVTKHGAVFLDVNGQTVTLPYKFLHVTPAMSPPCCLSECRQLVDDGGHLDVDCATLQHKRYPNIYGLGDCTNTPNSKTAAAVDFDEGAFKSNQDLMETIKAGESTYSYLYRRQQFASNYSIRAKQSRVLELNLWNTMYGKEPSAKYDGYGACPILTSYKTGILAEFLYDKKICETFPFDQSKERRVVYHLNKDVLPYLYWNKLIKGEWNGPARLRKFINPFGR